MPTDAEIIALVAKELMGYKQWAGIYRRPNTVHREPFRPLTDANDDVAVLRAVREKFTVDHVIRFVEELKTLRWARSSVSIAYSLELFAEIGDYTRAAYRVLQEQRNENIQA